jgi:hypothetical protein
MGVPRRARSARICAARTEAFPSNGRTTKGRTKAWTRASSTVKRACETPRIPTPFSRRKRGRGPRPGRTGGVASRAHCRVSGSDERTRSYRGGISIERHGWGVFALRMSNKTVVVDTSHRPFKKPRRPAAFGRGPEYVLLQQLFRRHVIPFATRFRSRDFVGRQGGHGDVLVSFRGRDFQSQDPVPPGGRREMQGRHVFSPNRLSPYSEHVGFASVHNRPTKKPHRLRLAADRWGRN